KFQRDSSTLRFVINVLWILIISYHKRFTLFSIDCRVEHRSWRKDHSCRNEGVSGSNSVERCDNVSILSD
ncbi:hypothetical protein PENTCL1PPCAC_27100, partial [Pristionchus entomophagus]